MDEYIPHPVLTMVEMDNGAKVLRAYLRTNESSRDIIHGTVLAYWRDEFVVWTVYCYTNQSNKFYSETGDYFNKIDYISAVDRFAVRVAEVIKRW